MDPQRWLAELRTELQTRRLPKRYVTRLMRELSDHVTDEWEKAMSKDAQMTPGPLERLGKPRVVAEAAEQALRSRSFPARHPLWTFGVFPPLLFVVLAAVMFVGSALIVDGVVDLTPLEKYESSPWAPVLARSYLVGCLVLAAVLVVVAFSGLAKRCGVTRRWPMTAALLIALACGCLWTGATQKTPEKMGTIMIGVPGSLRPTGITFPQLIQFAAPLAAAAWATRRQSQATGPARELRSAA
jgi:hypothetical protein